MKFVGISHNEVEDAYRLYRETLHYDIQKTYGWDEEFQQKRFMTEYELTSLHWICVEGKRVGLVCYKFSDESTHTHLLLITPTCQNLGYGRSAMAKVEKVAKARNLPVTLSVFKTSKAAYRFYTSIGYGIIGEDDTHIDLML